MSTVALDPDVRPEDRFISAFEMNHGESLNGTTAAVSQRREEALERFSALGIPTHKQEAWKYTNISKVIDRPYRLQLAPEGVDVSAGDIAPFLIDGLDAHRLVLVNGRVSEALSDIGDLPEGVVVSGLKAAGQSHPNLVEAHYGQYADYEDEALTALNTAFVQDGAFVYVPSGTVVDKPIFVLHVNASEEDLFIQPRHLFVAEEGSIARIVELQKSLTDHRTFTNTVTEAFVGDRGNLEHYCIQNEGDQASQVQTIGARHTDDSVFSTTTVTLSGEVVRNNLEITVDGSHCESNLFGLFIGRGEMHVDSHTLVDHAQPDCVSNELYKGILDDQSTGVFNGKVLVRRDSQRINAFQSNDSLVLSDDADMYSKPELEIYADDVECSHGATSGQIDDEALFYLRSRGLNERKARILMLRAFARDVLDEITIDAVRDHVDALMTESISRIAN
jgi:Fe-S cluster assembly protein SufD